MKKIIVTVVHPRLKYKAKVLLPSIKLNVRKVERIQRAPSRLASGLRDLIFEEKLKHKLTTIETT